MRQSGDLIMAMGRMNHGKWMFTLGWCWTGAMWRYPLWLSAFHAAPVFRQRERMGLSGSSCICPVHFYLVGIYVEPTPRQFGTAKTQRAWMTAADPAGNYAVLRVKSCRFALVGSYPCRVLRCAYGDLCVIHTFIHRAGNLRHTSVSGDPFGCPRRTETGPGGVAGN